MPLNKSNIRIWIALGVGLVTALVLTTIRGGAVETPLVPFFFAAVGISSFYFMCWICKQETLQAVENQFHRFHLSSHIRNILALMLCLSFIPWIGAVNLSGGYTGWLLMILFCLAAPLMICLLAFRYCLLLGLITNTCIIISILLENVREAAAAGDTDSWHVIVERRLAVWIIVWLVASFLSLIVSIPIMLQRQSIQSLIQQSIHQN